MPTNFSELRKQLYQATFGQTVLDMRLGVVLVLLIYFGTILIGNFTSYNLFWYTLGVPILGHLFADLQDVLVGLECTRRGFDVLAVDPCMAGAMMRPNYPRLWMALAPFGFGAKDSLWLGILIAFLFFVCVLWFAGKLNFSEASVYALALASPSVMLGVERSNIDLLLFLLLAVALALLQRHALLRGLGYSVIFLTGALKLFPIFAVIALLREKAKAAVGGLTVMVAAFAAYAFITFADLQRINQQVPRITGLGYGRTVITEVLQNSALFETIFRFRLQPDQATALSFILLGVCMALANVWAYKNYAAPQLANSFALDAFRVGVAIFIGTFAIGGVADYHLIFLLFTLPQLLLWFRFDPRQQKIAALTLLVLLSTLYLSRWSLTEDTAFWIPKKYYLPDELLNWFLLVSYSYLFLTSLPAWVKKILFLRKQTT